MRVRQNHKQTMIEGLVGLTIWRKDYAFQYDRFSVSTCFNAGPGFSVSFFPFFMNIRNDFDSYDSCVALLFLMASVNA